MSHVEFHVTDLATASAELTGRYGFQPVGAAGSEDTAAQSLVLRQGRITLVLTQGLADDHPASAYVHAHGDGVADIALSTSDVESAFADAVARGARAIREPSRHRDGRMTATIAGFGDVVHTFVEHDAAMATALPPGFSTLPAAGDAKGQLTELDHFAVCLEAGQLESTVDFYTRVLGFRMIFAERISVGAQAMDSKVVQSSTGLVTLTLIEPDTGAQPGQIDDFLKEHGGPGVQHVAFGAPDIVRAVGALRADGVRFLSVPQAYYSMLGDRLDLSRHSTPELRELSILVDADHGGQLFQIFTSSSHPRRTLFFEVIERLGASTFGSGNIKALYAAVEAERTMPQRLLS